MPNRIRIFTNPQHDKPDRRKPKGKSSLCRLDRDQIIAGASSLGVKVPFGQVKLTRKEKRALRFGETLPHLQHQHSKTSIGRKGSYRHSTDQLQLDKPESSGKPTRILYKRYSKQVGRGVPGSVKNAVPKSPYPKPKSK